MNHAVLGVQVLSRNRPQHKSVKFSNVLYYKKKNPVELKRCETPSSFSVFYVMY